MKELTSEVLELLNDIRRGIVTSKYGDIDKLTRDGISSLYVLRLGTEYIGLETYIKFSTDENVHPTKYLIGVYVKQYEKTYDLILIDYTDNCGTIVIKEDVILSN